ncbi:hypothetical protein HN873_038771 [Arachis hypogaea]
MMNLLSNKLDQPGTWHPAVNQALRTPGFYQLSRVGVIRGHSAMLAALVESDTRGRVTLIRPTDRQRGCD